jgi:hypothetical protein
MADYFSELGFRPLGEGETPDHAAHLLRLLRDSGNFELLQMMLEGRAGGGNVAPAASKEVVKNLPSIDPPKNGKSHFSGYIWEGMCSRLIFISKIQMLIMLLLTKYKLLVSHYRAVRSLFEEI